MTLEQFLKGQKEIKSPSAPPPRDIMQEARDITRASERFGGRLTQAQVRDFDIAAGRLGEITDRERTLDTQREVSRIGEYGPQMRQSLMDASPEMRRMAEMGERMGPSEIERSLTDQALADLQLGRSLTPEQERAATQAARSGYAARGMATGTPALAAEILNRDQVAGNREAGRRTFAMGIDAYTNDREGADRAFATQQAAFLDPQSRLAAVQNPGLQLAPNFQGANQVANHSSQAMTQNAANAMAAYQTQMGHYEWAQNNLGSYFDAQMNRQWSDQNNAANRRAGNSGAAASAAAGVATAALMLAMCWVARAVYGPADPRWMQFRAWLLTRAPRWLVRGYAHHGPRIASWLWKHPRVCIALRPIFNLCRP